jgi:hypothetical protein
VIGYYGRLGVADPNNHPGGRAGAAMWGDAKGNLWMMGGLGFDDQGIYGFFNDLWMFDVSANEWTWMGGSDSSSGTGFEDPIYGIEGTPSAANLPSLRSGASALADKSSNSFWMFAGFGYSSGGTGNTNELWSLNPASNEWTWMGGGPGANALVANSVEGVASPTNLPPGRASAASWIDATGNLWFFGGNVSAKTDSNDLWKYIVPGNVPAPAATPSFSPAGGTYTSPQSVTIADATSGTVVYYTTDGTTPTTNSTKYSGPIPVSSSETIQAIATATNYSTSAMASATYTINLPPSFTFGASSSSLAISAGGQGTATLTITPQNGFNSAVSFACSGLPAGVTCAFSPATVTPSGSSSATTQLTIAASSSASIAKPGSRPFVPYAALAALFGFIGIGLRRQRLLRWMLFLIATLPVLAAISACGGASSSGGGGGTNPPPETANVTVTATAGGLQQTATIALTVN